MRISFLPKTRYGKLSVKFLAAFLGLYLLSVGLVALTLRQAGDMVFLNPVFRPFIAVAGFSAIFSGLAAFGTGFLSVIKEKERSILACSSVFFGTLVLLFLLGEFLFPH